MDFDLEACGGPGFLTKREPTTVKKNPYTQRPELETASPTLSKVGRNMILQAAVLDEHDMESADAKSAFIQADAQEEKNHIWVRVSMRSRERWALHQ